MTGAERAALWSAIHQYVDACGGDRTDMTLSLLRQDAVRQIERAIDQLAVRLLPKQRARNTNSERGE